MAHGNEMKCPNCGAIMNHHGDKLIYESASVEQDVPFPGLVEEFWGCPACGAGASRPETTGNSC